MQDYGIDLAHELSSRCNGGWRAKVIPNEEGGTHHALSGRFTKTGERLVGQVAKRQAITNPENTISPSALHGRRFEEVNEEMKMVPYKVVRQGATWPSSRRTSSTPRPRFRR